MHVDRMSRLRPQGSQAVTAEAPVRSSDRVLSVPSGRPVLPPAPPIVLRVLQAGVLDRRFLFPDRGETRVIEEWKAPAVAPGPLLDAILEHLALLEAVLAPSERGVLLSRILALLSHFRAEANPPQVEQMIADDWAEDLGAFPIWAVEDACRTWRRTRKWRPQICEILALCTSVVDEAVIRRNRLRMVVAAAEASANPLAVRLQEMARNVFHKIPA